MKVRGFSLASSLLLLLGLPEFGNAKPPRELLLMGDAMIWPCAKRAFWTIHRSPLRFYGTLRNRAMYLDSLAQELTNEKRHRIRFNKSSVLIQSRNLAMLTSGDKSPNPEKDDTPTIKFVNNEEEEEIYKLLPYHNLETCYIVGRNYCYKTTSLLDPELGKIAEGVVATTWNISRHTHTVNGEEVLVKPVDRGELEYIDKLDASWARRFTELIQKGIVIVEDHASPKYRINEKKVVSLRKRTKVSETTISNIPIALENIVTMMKKRTHILYGIPEKSKNVINHQ